MSCLNGVGDHYGAIAVFQRLKTASNTGPQLYDQLGAAYHGLGRHDGAFDACAESLRLGSRSIVAIRGILRLALETGRNEEVAARYAAEYEREVARDSEALLCIGLMSLSESDPCPEYAVLTRSSRAESAYSG